MPVMHAQHCAVYMCACRARTVLFELKECQMESLGKVTKRMYTVVLLTALGYV
jgi:hypothetical protein